MFRNVLVPIDLSDKHSWRKALPAAIAMCEAFGARLSVITVVPGFGLPIVGQAFPEGYEDKLRQQAARQLKAFVAEQVPDALPTRRIVAEGRIYREILSAAKAIEADLIVMGAHHPELKDYLLGPNAARVVRHADCSVMVVRE
jgi:nucleotide-binding universal stress UspA family protein